MVSGSVGSSQWFRCSGAHRGLRHGKVYSVNLRAETVVGTPPQRGRWSVSTKCSRSNKSLPYHPENTR